MGDSQGHATRLAGFYVMGTVLYCQQGGTEGEKKRPTSTFFNVVKFRKVNRENRDGPDRI